MTDTDPPTPPTRRTTPPPIVAPAVESSPNYLVFLATGILVMFFVMLLVLSFHTVPADNKDLIDTLLGVLAGTGFGSIVSYFFGTSSGSARKDATIQNLVKGGP